MHAGRVHRMKQWVSAKMLQMWYRKPHLQCSETARVVLGFFYEAGAYGIEAGFIDEDS